MSNIYHYAIWYLPVCSLLKVEKIRIKRHQNRIEWHCELWSGRAPKENSVNSRNLVNHWSMNWDWFKYLFCYQCLIGYEVAQGVAGSNNTFYYKYVTEFSKNIQGKLKYATECNLQDKKTFQWDAYCPLMCPVFLPLGYDVTSCLVPCFLQGVSVPGRGIYFRGYDEKALPPPPPPPRLWTDKRVLDEHNCR